MNGLDMDSVDPRPRCDREQQADLEQLRQEGAHLLAEQRAAEGRHDVAQAAFLKGLRADLELRMAELRAIPMGDEPEGAEL